MKITPKKIGPREMRAVYLRAAELCLRYLTDRRSRPAAYGCYAIQEAVVDRMPWTFNDSVLFNRVVGQLCDLFVSHFRNEIEGWEEKRQLYGEFGPCTHQRTQLHRVTALCLMAEFIVDYA